METWCTLSNTKITHTRVQKVSMAHSCPALRIAMTRFPSCDVARNFKTGFIQYKLAHRLPESCVKRLNFYSRTTRGVDKSIFFTTSTYLSKSFCPSRARDAHATHYEDAHPDTYEEP